MNTYLLILMIGLTGLAGIYALGLLMLPWLKPEGCHPYQRSFWALFMGSLSLAIGYALVRTGFQSYLLVLLLVWIGSWSVDRTPGPNDSHSTGNWKPALGLLGALIGFLFFTGYLWVRTSHEAVGEFFYSFRDEVFYSQIAGFLNETGVESILLDWKHHVELLGSAPYHYAEIWLTAFFGRISPGTDLHAHGWITTPLLLTMLSTAYGALYSWWDKAAQKPWLGLTVSLFLCFMGPLLISWTGISLQGGTMLLFSTKMILPFLTVVGMVLSFSEGRYARMLMMSLALPVFNYGFLPIVLGAFLIGLVWLWWKKHGTLRLRLIMIAAPVLWLLLWGSLGLLRESAVESLTQIGLTELMAYYGQGFGAIKGALHLLFLKGLDGLGRLWIYILIGAIAGRLTLGHLRPWIPLIVYALLFMAAGLAGAAILLFAMDTVQLYVASITVWGNVLVGIVIWQLISMEKRHWVHLLGLGLVFYFAYFHFFQTDRSQYRLSRYSDDFLEELVAHKSFFEGPGGRFLDGTYYQTAYDVNPNCNFEGYYLSYLQDGLVVHTLSLREIPDKESYFNFFNSNRDRITASAYYQYFAENYPEPIVDEAAMQFAFVQQENLAFVLSTDLKLIPPAIQALYRQKLVDDASGEVILFDPSF